MRATSCEPTLKKGFQIIGGRQGSLPGHLHALENHQQSDLRLQHRAHDGRTDGPHAPGTRANRRSAAPESDRPSATPRATSHAAGRLRGAPPQLRVLCGRRPLPRRFCFIPQMQETNRTGGSPDCRTLADGANPPPLLTRCCTLTSLSLLSGFSFPPQLNLLEAETTSRRKTLKEKTCSLIIPCSSICRGTIPLV